METTKSEIHKRNRSRVGMNNYGVGVVVGCGFKLHTWHCQYSTREPIPVGKIFSNRSSFGPMV